MTMTIERTTYDTLSGKAYLFDTQLQPILQQYQHYIYGLIAVVILFGMIAAWFGYKWWETSHTARYYKQVLNANFGWFKKGK